MNYINCPKVIFNSKSDCEADKKFLKKQKILWKQVSRSLHDEFHETLKLVINGISDLCNFSETILFIKNSKTAETK
jgi:hypothetical protein